jgi:hypothetical protein
MFFIALLAVALLVSSSAVAQDKLVKRNGEKMNVKVLKITKKKVKFVRHGTELPVYKLPISDIDYIEYPMGDRDTFEHNKTIQKPVTKEELPKWHGAVPPHNGATDAIIVPREKRRYSIGDIYNENGVVGIVISLTGDGSHGTLMSLDETCLAWCTLKRTQTKKTSTGANDSFDGEKNMAAIEKYIAENNLSWEAFPAFKWCRDKGKGWFLPSINELWSAGTMYMGGSRSALNRHFRKNFNNNLESAGGTPLSNIMIYYSSTENKDTRFAQYSHMNAEPPFIQSCYKADELFVRAFHKF